MYRIISKVLLIGLITFTVLMGANLNVKDQNTIWMRDVTVTTPDNSITFPEIVVTAPRYNYEDIAMVTMPELVVTAPRPEEPVREIAMTSEANGYDAAYALHQSDYDNAFEDNSIGYKAFKEKLYDYKSNDRLNTPEFILATVQVRADKYKKIKGKLIIEKGDTVSEGISFSGGQARIDGVLDGDFSIKGGTVDVNGMIDGDVSVFGGTMNVTGKVKGDAAVFGGDIYNKGTINGDLLVTGGNIKLDSGSVVTGDIAIIGGAIEKDTNATVNGEIKSVSSKLFNKAFPKFPSLIRLSERLPETLTFTASALVAIFVIVGFFVITLLVVLLFPKSVEKIAETTHKNVWIPIAIGIGIQLLIVPLIVLLAVSLVGIPIIPLFILALFACLIIGFSSIYYLIGVRIKHTTDGKQDTVAKFALGFIVIMAIPLLGALIRIISPVGGLFSVLGGVIIYVVATIGMGAAFYTLVTRKRQ